MHEPCSILQMQQRTENREFQGSSYAMPISGMNAVTRSAVPPHQKVAPVLLLLADLNFLQNQTILQPHREEQHIC